MRVEYSNPWYHICADAFLYSYITHSEWASSDAFSASAGSGARASTGSGTFRRLPFNFCAVSLQPFRHAVCTADGTIFDLTNILPWLKKHGTNPVDGKPMKSADLIKLKFAKNDDGEYVDPVTYKAFTDNTHIVALKKTGNVFAWDTVDRLNIKSKMWRDLVSDDEFTRKDIIQLQDPQNLAGRNLSSFKYLQDGTSTLTPEQEMERNDPTNGLNMSAMGSSAKVIKAKEAVAKARADRAASTYNHSGTGQLGSRALTKNGTDAGASRQRTMPPLRTVPYNAAQHTSGQAAASFTSTGLTPHTSNERALLSEEEYMLQARMVKEKGYARIQTTQGDLNIELNAEFAPRAVWNFVKLSKRGYYNGVAFHRNIRNFMLQGGDPTATGRGGQSVWGKPFIDEYAQSPLKHNTRGVMSMANKGKNTNTSQFFITYRAASHLDNKHTIFGKIIDDDQGGESQATLTRLENVPTDDGNKPLQECAIENVVVFVEPFEEFSKNKEKRDKDVKHKEEIERSGGTEDDHTTWTGKRIRDDIRSGDQSSDVGRYLPTPSSNGGDEIVDEVIDEWDAPEEPATKKRKAGFGNFDSW